MKKKFTILKYIFLLIFFKSIFSYISCSRKKSNSLPAIIALLGNQKNEYYCQDSLKEENDGKNNNKITENSNENSQNNSPDFQLIKNIFWKDIKNKNEINKIKTLARSSSLSLNNNNLSNLSSIIKNKKNTNSTNDSDSEINSCYSVSSNKSYKLIKETIIFKNSQLENNNNLISQIEKNE
jgi:hypothetical protein